MLNYIFMSISDLQQFSRLASGKQNLLIRTVNFHGRHYHPPFLRVGLRAYNKMRNGRVAGDLGLREGARKETALRDSAQLHLGNPIAGLGKPISFMDIRPTSNAAAAPKIRQPEGLFTGGGAGGGARP